MSEKQGTLGTSSPAVSPGMEVFLPAYNNLLGTPNFLYYSLFIYLFNFLPRGNIVWSQCSPPPRHFHAQGVLSWPWAVTHRLQGCQTRRDGRMTGLPWFSPSQHNWMVHLSAWPKKKGIREQLAALTYTAVGRGIQTMTAILKGNLYNPGNLDIKVSKLRWTQNKYIHIFYHIQNNNPEPQMTFLSLSLPACSRTGGGDWLARPSRLPTAPHLVQQPWAPKQGSVALAAT